jgi:hypothetical protein
MMRLIMAVLLFASEFVIQGIALAQSPYIRLCQEKEVPIPPKWGDPRWRKLKDDLPREITFDTGGKDYSTTEVWVYSDDKGTCMALPRIDAAGDIQLLGIICQGKTGNACFWDNIPIGSDDRITGKKTKGMDAASIQGGNELNENCTNCHRGKNAFVVHPGSSLDPKMWPKIGFDGTAEPKPQEVKPEIGKFKGWYTPVSKQGGWVNKEGSLQCGSECHFMPELTNGYCDLLAKEVGVTMPPDDKDVGTKKGDWKDGYEDAVKALKKACEEQFGERKWKIDGP